MRIHVIAVGGRIMHTIAIDLKQKGHQVTGSDDEIYDPSRERLEKAGILPDQFGWDKNRISESIDLVILGMHAKADNPELIKAQELGIEIISYPEYIYRVTQSKKRIVIAGSHGKTTTTSMIMHVLKDRGIEFDYLVGAELDGFDAMVKLTDAKLIVIEGDEYLSSAIDPRAKMLHYKADLAVITGVSWDHINVFPTYQDYLNVFDEFLADLPSESYVYFFEDDQDLLNLVLNKSYIVPRESYGILNHNKRGQLLYNGKKIKVEVFGNHNLANMGAALKITSALGVKPLEFYQSIQSFKGAAKRLELLFENDKLKVFRDFAHAPSKVKASAEAIRKKFPKAYIKVFLELHTYSSLNKAFIPHYKGSLDKINELMVYYNSYTLEIKKMEGLDKVFLETSFNHKQLQISTDKSEVLQYLSTSHNDQTEILLIMSSGPIANIELSEIF